MNPSSRPRPDQRMTRRFVADRTPRASNTAAIAALLVLAFLVALAVGLMGGGDALPDLDFGKSFQDTGSATSVDGVVAVPEQPVESTQAPRNPEDAQPIAIF